MAVLLGTITGTCLLTQPKPIQAQGYHQPIIQTGDPLPGTTEVAMDFFSPDSNRNAQVSFIDGVLSNPTDVAVYLVHSGLTQEIARLGDPILNGLGNLGGILGTSAFLSPSGRVGFVAVGTGAGLGTNDTFLFLSNGSGGLITIAREGDPAGTNGVFGQFSNAARPRIDSNGNMYFFSSLSGTAGGTADNQGIFRSNGTAKIELVRKGNSAAGNGAFSIFNPHTPNDQNQIAFNASLIGTTGGTADDRGIFRTDGSSLVQIVRHGLAVPDGNGIFSDIKTSSPPINQSGQVAFVCNLSGTTGTPGDTTGIFRGEGGAITQIARGGTPAPEGNGTIVGFANSSLSDFNNNGTVLYHGLLTNNGGGTADNQGLYLADGTNTINIMREGQPAPGDGFFVSPGGGVVNDIGTVVFNSFVASMPGASSSVEGTFLGDGTEIVEVMRSGDALGNSTILFAGAFRNSFTADGQFVYQANLANGEKLIGRFTPDLHYRAVTSGDWDDRDNWTVGIQPNGVHDVFIDSDSDVSVSGPTGDLALRSLQIGGGAASSTLVMNGSEIAVNDQVFVAANGQLAGSGQLNGVAVVDGNISPGDSAGIIGIQGSLELSSLSNLSIELGGLNPPDFDRVSVIGAAQLEGTLTVDLIDGFTLATGDQFLILETTGGTSGHFMDLNPGALVDSFAGTELFISYAGGNGNDVLLYTIGVLGDVNGDGEVNLLDVSAFVNALSSGAFDPEADINRDGVVNLLDVSPFVALLTG